MPKVPQKKIVSNSVFRGGARRLRYCHLESPDDRHLPVALISVFVSYDRTVANGIRVSVLCDDFGNSEKACGRDPCEIDSAHERDGIPDDGLDPKIGEDMRGSFTEESAKERIVRITWTEAVPRRR